MQEHDDQVREQNSVISILSAATKRMLRVVFRRTKPASNLSRHLTPEEIESFQAEMDAHGVDDHTPPLRKRDH